MTNFFSRLLLAAAALSAFAACCVAAAQDLPGEARWRNRFNGGPNATPPVQQLIDESLRTGDASRFAEIRRIINETSQSGSSMGEPAVSRVRLHEAGLALADGRGVDAADRFARNGLVNDQTGERRWAITLPNSRGDGGWRLGGLPSPQTPPPLWTWTLIDPAQLRLYVGARALAGSVSPLEGVRRGEEVAANWWSRAPSPGVYVRETVAMARRLHNGAGVDARGLLLLANVDAIVQFRAFDQQGVAFVITQASQRALATGRPPQSPMEAMMAEMVRGTTSTDLFRRFYGDAGAAEQMTALYAMLPEQHRARAVDQLDTENYAPFAQVIDGAFAGRCASGAAIADKPRVLIILEPDRSFTPIHLARFANGRRLLDCYEFVHAPDVASAAAAAERARRWRTNASLAGIWNPDGTLPGAEGERALARAAFTRGHADLTRVPAAGLIDRFSRAGAYWHFATHGVADWENAFNGYIKLAGDQRLPIGAVFNASPSQAPRLVILSACESAVAQSIVGRTISMHAGLSYPSAFLSAGAMGVIASMWPVADDATALLMGRFYELHIGAGIEPPAALNQAQIWLRDATDAQLLIWIDARAANADDDDQAALDTLAGAVLNRARNGVTRPYASTHYWGAFSYFGA